MKNNLTSYYIHRIKLEKLKRATWICVVVAKGMSFLAHKVSCYFEQILTEDSHGLRTVRFGLSADKRQILPLIESFSDVTMRL